MRGSGSARGLVRSASGSLALNVGNTVVSILATIALARLMDLASFGIYSWVVATVTMLTVPALLGMDRLLVRDVAIHQNQGAQGTTRGLIVRSMQLVLLVATAMIAVGVLLGVLTDGPDTPLLPLAVGLLALPALSLLRAAQAAMVGLHHVVRGQLGDLLLRPAFLLGLILVTIVGGITLDATVAVGIYTVSGVAALAIALLLLRRTMASSISQPSTGYDTRRLLGAATGLMLLGGGIVINTQIGVVLLGLLDVPESAGLYAVAQRGALLVAFPLLALNVALAPRAAGLWSSGRRDELQRLITIGSRGVLLLALPGAVIFIVAGATVLSLIFGASYAPAAPALAILTLGQLANVATGSVATVLVMTGNERRAGAGVLVGVTLNIGLGIILIPALHTVGAAIAAAVSLVVANCIHVWLARRTLGLDTTAIGLRARHDGVSS
jgi:O-antigen/teichoic acid export membrane protein